MTGVFFNPENLQEEIPKVVREFEEKKLFQYENDEEESEVNPKNLQDKVANFLEELSGALDNDEVGEDLRENILNGFEEVRRKLNDNSAEN